MPISPKIIVTSRLDQAALRELTSGRTSPVYQAVQRGSRKVVDHAKLDLTAKGIGDTGQLRNQIEYNVTTEGTTLVGRVTSTAAHSIYVHEGTRGPIVPRTARVLRFTVKGAGVVYARKVRGTRETGRYTPFLTNGLDRLKLSDFL